MNKNSLNAIGLLMGLALLGSVNAHADYYGGSCEQNSRAEVICQNQWVRDINTGSIGFVTGTYGYYNVTVRFERGAYGGRTYSMSVEQLQPSYQPMPRPAPYPYPMPYPRPYPQPYPVPGPFPGDHHGHGGWDGHDHDGHGDHGHDGRHF